MEQNPTHFASAERENPQKLLKLSNELYSDSKIIGLIDSVPLPAMLINQQRQVMVLNKKLLEMLGSGDPSSFIGMRPGEIFNCIHSRKSPGGCGTASDCQFCGAIDAVLESMKTGEKVEREARLITDSEGKDVHFDMLVSSSPMEIESENYFIVTMVDITSDKRKEALEKAFIHDIGNMIQGLSGSLYMIKSMKDPTVVRELLDTSERLTSSLMEEISYHKDLIAAENRELKVKSTQIFSIDFMDDVIRHVIPLDVAEGKTIHVKNDAERFTFKTDLRLLRRVVVNMLKNALEASSEGDNVELGCYQEDHTTVITVWNKSVMPEKVRSQLWQRSFSTKGRDRGLGTYSMKLFVDEYLKGSITFTSEEEKGTTFRVEIPDSRE